MYRRFLREKCLIKYRSFSTSHSVLPENCLKNNTPNNTPFLKSLNWGINNTPNNTPARNTDIRLECNEYGEQEPRNKNTDMSVRRKMMIAKVLRLGIGELYRQTNIQENIIEQSNFNPTRMRKSSLLVRVRNARQF